MYAQDSFQPFTMELVNFNLFCDEDSLLPSPCKYPPISKHQDQVGGSLTYVTVSYKLRHAESSAHHPLASQNDASVKCERFGTTFINYSSK